LKGLLETLEGAYAEYRFNEAAQALYDFFWGEYCDGYVEAAKTELFGEDAEAKKAALAVMDVVLSAFLRVLSPFMPHLCAELWETMGFAAPNHGHKEEKESLMYAAWPQAATLLAGLDPQALADARERVAAVYEAAALARALRAEVRIPSNKKVRLFLKPRPAWAAQESGTFGRLVNAESVTLDPAYQPAKGEPRVLTPLGELYLPLEGLVDNAGELARLQKEIAKVEAELALVRKKLGNENFVGNAPAAVVAEHRKREADWTQKREQLQKMKEALGAA